jgi:hypothetical protein
MRRFRISITKMNNIGDSGSPCLSPCPCVMDCLGTPFSKICVEEVASIPHTISHQILPNPSVSSTSIKKVQETESKAFVISSFSIAYAKTLLLNQHEIILNEPPFNEITLILGHQGV